MPLFYMTLYDYIQQLSPSELEEYATKCSTSPGYIEVHIKHARKVPRPALMDNLHLQSEGKVSKKEVLEHFYKSSESVA